jgi:proton-translocating NADH-quinone oxidoreductase chain M
MGADIFFYDSLRYSYFLLNIFGNDIFFVVDGYSFIFLFLTALLVPVCVLVGWESIKNDFFLYNIMIFLSIFILNIVFLVVDLLVFFIFFELLMIPLFFLIGKWGSRAESLVASFYFWFYTLVGSFFLLLGILLIYLYSGGFFFLNYVYLFNNHETVSFIVFISLFIGFMLKIPVGPFFHLCLPQAHVEAPTAGSVLLAGIILKIGAYGIIRFLIPVFGYYLIKYNVFFCFFSILSVVVVLWNIEACTDLKKMIAYMSISHMNLALMALLCNVDNFLGLQSFIFFMFSHGVVSVGLFASVGFLYERVGSRDLTKVFSLRNQPMFSGFFLFFFLANMAFPPLSSFVCELLVYMSLGMGSIFVLFLSMIGFFLNGYISILIFFKLFIGECHIQYIPFYDLTNRELTVSVFLTSMVVLLGLFPNFLFNMVELDVQYTLMEMRYFFSYKIASTIL